MTHEEKQILLKDLCGRLPYGVKFQGEDSNVYILDAANYFALQVEDMVFKPYLRPLSSMTAEELSFYNNHLITPGITILEENLSEYLDWMHSHYFDYRGLIEKGLALEAPEGMYKTE